MTLHPNVHVRHQKWSNEQILHIAVPYSNPYRWQTRRRLMNDFRHHMSMTPNVVLHVAELAYGDRDYEVTGDDPNDIQLRTESVLFHKENILNIAISRFPNDWKYGAYVDADFTFTRHDWALETIHQLQHHAFVQPFSTYADLSAKVYGGSKPGPIGKSFAANYIDNNYSIPANAGTVTYSDGNKQGKWIPVGATGGAWAFTRGALDTVGGLMEHCILGHGDWFMTFGLIQKRAMDMRDSKYHPSYAGMINAWHAKAKNLSFNIGYVDQFVVHHFHGSKKNRAYSSRDQILVHHQFDPINDLRKNWQGIYELSGNKPKFRDAVRQYFISRNEDDPSA